MWLFFCLFDFIGFFWFWLLFCFILANLQDTFGVWHLLVKGTRRKKAPSNKTLALAKSWNMEIWVVGTSNQLFVRGSSVETKCSKKSINKAVTGKTPFFVIGLFCTYHFVCLNIGFCYGSFIWKWCFFYLRAFNYKTVLQFFEKVFHFPENVFQS